jgi:hypothetical protein
MASSISVKAEDRLEGATNFNVWKLRITNILQEHDLEQVCDSKIAQIRDQLLVRGVTVDDDDLMQAIFYSLPSSWETFLSSVSGREIQPTFERLWNDFLQE